jgi:3-oxoacyl-(acyl-carrier-protein) synthase
MTAGADLNADHHGPIAIASVGLVSALGWGLKPTFDRLMAGDSGATEGSWNFGRFGPLPWAGYPLPSGGPLQRPGWDDHVFRILESATGEAIAESGIDFGQIDPERIGVVVSLSKGAVGKLGRNIHGRDDSAATFPDRFDETFWTNASPSAGARFVAGLLSAGGPVLAPVTACASGLTALRHGAGLLERGEADIVIAGAADASLDPLVYAAFARMRSLAGPSFEGESVAKWLKPWSRRRNGFLIGEGGAIFVLFRMSDKISVKSQDMVVLDGFAAGSEAFHPTRPRQSAELLSRVVARAIRAGDHFPDLIHLHATATREYDRMEFDAVQNVQGKALAESWLVASKPGIGHCLGAAGAVELGICFESLRRQMVPPFDPGPDSEMGESLRLPGKSGVAAPLSRALKIVAGFGGHMEVCQLRLIGEIVES